MTKSEQDVEGELTFVSPQYAAALVSASFTAPTDALLVCTVQMDTQAAANPVIAVSDSGGLTWTNRVERQDQETTIGGYSSVATARTTSSVSRTVTVGWTSGSGADTTRRISAKVYVLTGVDVNGTPLAHSPLYARMENESAYFVHAGRTR